MEEPTKYSIKAEQLQAILQYLDSKPHNEVRSLIDMLISIVNKEQESKPEKNKSKRPTK